MLQNSIRGRVSPVCNSRSALDVWRNTLGSLSQWRWCHLRTEVMLSASHDGLRDSRISHWSPIEPSPFRSPSYWQATFSLGYHGHSQLWYGLCDWYSGCEEVQILQVHYISPLLGRITPHSQFNNRNQKNGRSSWFWACNKLGSEMIVVLLEES